MGVVKLRKEEVQEATGAPAPVATLGELVVETVGDWTFAANGSGESQEIEIENYQSATVPDEAWALWHKGYLIEILDIGGGSPRKPESEIIDAIEAYLGT